MSHRAVKKQVKKKLGDNHKKKTLRKKLLKKLVQAEQQQIIPATNQQNILNQNTLRSQLLARASLGFIPQQYGNINNERKIEQIRNDTNTLTQRINSDKAIIDTMSQEKAKLEGDIKGLKKAKKEAKAKLDKAKADEEMLKDEVSEAERIESETRRHKQRAMNAQQQLAEIDRKNDIIKYKTEADSLEGQVHKRKLENEQLQRNYEANKEYQRLLSLREEVKNETNKNTGLLQAMKDPSFAQPNEETIALQKQIELQKYNNQLMNNYKDKMIEKQNLEMQRNSMPSEEEYKALTTQQIEGIKAKNAEILTLKNEIAKQQGSVDEYEYLKAKNIALDKQVLDAKDKREILQAQAAKLDNTAKRELGTNIQAKLTTLGNAIATNRKKEWRIKNAERAQQLKEDSFVNDIVAGKLKEPLSKDDAGILIDIAQAEANKAITEEQNKSIKANRAANFELAKAKARKAVEESPDVTSAYNEIAQQEYNTNKAIKEKEELDLLNKLDEQKKIAQFEVNIKSGHMNDELPLVQQAISLEKQLTGTLGEIDQKTKLIEAILELSKQFPDRWQEFIAMNPGAALLSLDSAQNRDIADLNGILNGFKGYLSKNPPDKIEDTSPQTVPLPSGAQDDFLE